MGRKKNHVSLCCVWTHSFTFLPPRPPLWSYLSVAVASTLKGAILIPFPATTEHQLTATVAVTNGTEIDCRSS